MRFKAGARVLVRLTDGSEWLGDAAPRSWWRALTAPRTLELVNVVDVPTGQHLDGTLYVGRRFIVTAQVV